MTMHMSPRGRAFLRAHEGDVLKAYRDPVGIWTIGVGLTAASGVVVPKAGMTITREESDRLLKLALTRNYEPAVRQAMPNAKPHEFDGGTSFHFNTGAIGRATWVKRWLAKAGADKIRASLMQWVKGGGRVLPGLRRRRQEEADVILLDRWPTYIKAPAETPTIAQAVFVVAMTPEEIETVADAFEELGYDPGTVEGKIRLRAVTDFQLRYDLTVDGRIGRATLSTLQRELDGRRKAAQAVTAAAGGGTVAGGNEAAAPDPSTVLDPAIVGDPLVTWIGLSVVALALIVLALLAWRYRDLVAARLADRFPKIATWLRSF